MDIKTETLAYWYFRINGCLTIPNFVVHPDTGNRQRTEIDIIAVRFPYRKELLINPMLDHSILSIDKRRTLIILSEVKRGICSINDSWINPRKKNLKPIISSIGAFPQDTLYRVSRVLYSKGVFSDSLYKIEFFCIGGRESQQLKKKFPKVPQVLWRDILEFIYTRFSGYRNQKESHPQWDSDGQSLWTIFKNSNSLDQFIEQIKIT